MRTVNDILDLLKFNSTDSNLTDLKWKAIFVDFFIEEDEECEDDLLFFVPRPINRRDKQSLQVRRKFAPNLPLESPWINWEESLFLNLLMQKLQYSIIFSILTPTGKEQYQFLSKATVPVHATPSYHSVVYKQCNEQYSYPLINFNVENFEEFIYENVINDLESIYIELLVSMNANHQPIVLHTTSVSYRSVDEAYHKRRLNNNNQAYKYFGMLRVNSNDSEGTTEVVIKKKIKRSVSESSSGSIVFNDEDEHSHTSLQLYLVNLNRLRPRDNCYCSSNNLAKIRDTNQVYTVDSEDCFASDEMLNEFWNEPGFVQAYFEWKTRMKRESNTFHVFVSNISLPWNHIISRLISNHQQSSMFIL